MTISIKEITVGELIGYSRTTPVSTGWRAYEGTKHGEKMLVMHYEGTPANKQYTACYHPNEAKIEFAWEIKEALNGRYPHFVRVARWIEHNT